MVNKKKEIENQSKAWGVASIITGCFSIPLMFAPYFGLPLAIVAIVGNVMQKKITPTGAGTAGMICGIIGLVLNLMMVFLIVAYLLMFGIPADI